MFVVNNKNTRTTSLTSFWFACFSFRICSTLFSSVSIVDFEKVNVNWVTNFKATNKTLILMFHIYPKWKVLSASFFLNACRTSLLIVFVFQICAPKTDNNTKSQSPGGCLPKYCSEKLRKIRRKTTVRKSFFNKLEVSETTALLKGDSNTCAFLLILQKFFRTALFLDTSKRLLLNDSFLLFLHRFFVES